MLGSLYLGVCAGLIALALAMPYRVDLLPPALVAGCAMAGGSFIFGMTKLWVSDAPPRVLPAPTLTIVHRENEGRTLRLPPDCPASWDQVYTIAVRVIAGGAGVTYRDHQDLFTPQSAYKKFYNWLMKEGYSVDNGDGAEITDAGIGFFSTFYQLPQLTSPAEAVYAYETDSPVTHTAAHHD